MQERDATADQAALENHVRRYTSCKQWLLLYGPFIRTGGHFHNKIRTKTYAGGHVSTLLPTVFGKNYVKHCWT